MTGAERAAGLSALAALLHDERTQWLTPVNRLGRAENKPYQYRRAAARAVPVPEWLITTDSDQAPSDDGWVTKPLGPGSFMTDDGHAHVVPTSVFAPQTRLALAAAPFLIQRQITARSHARVVTVGEAVFSSTLPALGQPLDWRQSAGAHSGFTTRPAPGHVHALAVAAATACGVGYSAQDWIEDPEGSWWFVDLNPSGQWLFLPAPVATRVTEAIAQFLEGSG
jgi:glutathione synthase/RimK-type ligase-like ATP-grasp enzyme